MKKFVYIFILVISYTSITIAGTKEVQEFADDVANKIISIVKKNTDQKVKSQQLYELIKSNFDVQWMSRFTLARNYKKLSEEQRRSYIDLYSSYLNNSYSPILMKYSDESYKINKVTKSGPKDYDVDITIVRKDASPLKLKYHIKEVAPKSYKAVDMVIEGVSTILNQRSEFASIIQNKGIDGLLGDLREGKIKSKHNVD